MNEAHESRYLELDSVNTCSREAVKKGQAAADLENVCQRDIVFLRRMLFVMSAVAVVALLTAAAALFLAISKAKGKDSYRGVLIYEVDMLYQLKYVQETIIALISWIAKCEGCTRRLKSARGLDSTDRAQRGPYIEGRGPIFSKHDPEQDWLIRGLLHVLNYQSKIVKTRSCNIFRHRARSNT